MTNGANDHLSHSVPPESGPNSLGIAGFVVSLVGLVSCGLLAPIGLVLSLMGMRRQPNGLAIAGAVIGLIGSILLVASVAFTILVLQSMRTQYSIMGDLVEQMDRVEAGSKLINEFARTNNRLPSKQEAKTIFTKLGSEGDRLVFEPEEFGSYTITDIGADGKFGTSDDWDMPGFTATSSQ